MGRDKGRERWLTKYCHGQNQLDLGKLVLFITNQIRIEKKRKKPQNLKQFSLTPTFFPGSSSLPNSLAPSPNGCRRIRNGSCGQFITHCLYLFFLCKGGLLIFFLLHYGFPKGHSLLDGSASSSLGSSRDLCSTMELNRAHASPSSALQAAGG